MKTVIISGSESKKMNQLLQLAKELGLGVHTISRAEAADLSLGIMIEEGMKSGKATRGEVMKALGK